MNDNQKAAVWGMILLSFSIGVVMGYWITSDVYKSHALKAGVAFYDSQSGEFWYGIPEEEVKAKEAE